MPVAASIFFFFFISCFTLYWVIMFNLKLNSSSDFGIFSTLKFLKSHQYIISFSLASLVSPFQLVFSISGFSHLKTETSIHLTTGTQYSYLNYKVIQLGNYYISSNIYILLIKILLCFDVVNCPLQLLTI